MERPRVSTEGGQVSVGSGSVMGEGVALVTVVVVAEVEVDGDLSDVRFIMFIQALPAVHCRHGFPEASSTTPEARRL